MRRFRWTVEIEVDETWVADGFNLTQERLESILQSALPYSSSGETRGCIISAPDPREIVTVQG